MKIDKRAPRVEHFNSLIYLKVATTGVESVMIIVAVFKKFAKSFP